MLHKKLHIPINIPLSTDFKIESNEFDYEIIDGDWNHKGFSSKGDPLHEIWSQRK